LKTQGPLSAYLTPQPMCTKRDGRHCRKHQHRQCQALHWASRTWGLDFDKSVVISNQIESRIPQHCFDYCECSMVFLTCGKTTHF